MTPEKDLLPESSLQNNFGYKLAPPLTRLGAAIIEGILIYVPLYFILGYDNPFYAGDAFDFQSNFMQAALTGILGAIFYSLWSGNLGHRLFGLKVISAVDGSDQKKATVGAIREILKTFLGIVIIPSIWLLWDSKNQNLYDKIMKTLVVEAP